MAAGQGLRHAPRRLLITLIGRPAWLWLGALREGLESGPKGALVGLGVAEG